MGNRSVSCSGCMRACARSGSPSDISAETSPPALFPFPFGLAYLSLFPCKILVALLIGTNEIKGIPVSPNEMR